MDGENLDKALYECMNVIWRAYRDSVTAGDFSAFNRCFKPLYEKYDDDIVTYFIQSLGMSLTPATMRRIKKDGDTSVESADRGKTDGGNIGVGQLSLDIK